MVSSRSKTAAETVANRRTTRSASGAAGGLKALDTTDRENKPTKTAVSSSTKAAAKKHVSKSASKPVSSATSGKPGAHKKKGGTYCVCKGEDDGTPMIKCEGGCQNWYHFRCVDLSEDVAGEIERYCCSDCEAKTGLKTVSKLDFEGSDALFEVDTTPEARRTSASRKKTPLEEAEEIESVEESDEDGTEDEYVADSPVGKKAKTGRRTTRRLSFSSDKSVFDSDDDSDEGHHRLSRGGRRLKRIKKTSLSPSPGLSSVLKRRGSSSQQPAAKRPKTSEETFAQDDAVRRYCLTKLGEIVRAMFEEYQDGETESGSQEKGEIGSESRDSASKELAEDEKTAINHKATSFVAELERCMMDTYAELDKSGKPSAGGKYKERFRMLQFNLPKSDRIVLRKGIATGRITPAQLNVMSSTELADEQTKHDIEIAEKESLEHSILQKITAPRAKITHKGFEAIEDVSGQRTADAAKEEEEQRMEMEKREREKLARLRSLSHQEDSPVTPVEPSPLSTSSTVANATQPQQPWGALPPLPVHAIQNQFESAPAGSPISGRPHVRPLFVPTANDYASAEQGLSLADLINIDDDLPREVPQSTPQQRMSAQFNAESGSSSSPVITTPSGPSPFASRPVESLRRTSFDLNWLWSGPDGEDPSVDSKPRQGASVVENTAVEVAEENQDDAMDLESVEDYDDRALDAILEQGGDADQKIDSPSQVEPADVDSLPQVWEGQICMPMETLGSLAPDVKCRQIGGRTLEPLSGFWQTLFPSPQARIDGRVPMKSSTQYMISMRLNPSKELIAVCFTPPSEEAKMKLGELISYLVGKDRHALVFPWGAHPKPQAPGRELYLIPFLKDQPIPEYIELLDDLHLPKERKTDVLLGVFVLNKGKLSASTPPPQPVPSVPAATSTGANPSVSGLPLQNVLPNMTITPTNTPASVLPMSPAQPVKIDQAALAAEVASLTPEQISLMLRHLTQSMPMGTTAGASMPPSAGPSALSMPSMPTMPPFPPQFPPTYQQHMQSPTQHFSPPRPSGQGGYGEYDYEDHDDYQRQPYGRGGRGGRGRRAGRGRGRPHNDDRDARQRELDRRFADQGWGSRGHSGGPSGNPQERRSRFATG